MIVIDASTMVGATLKPGSLDSAAVRMPDAATSLPGALLQAEERRQGVAYDLHHFVVQLSE